MKKRGKKISPESEDRIVKEFLKTHPSASLKEIKPYGKTMKTMTYIFNNTTKEACLIHKRCHSRSETYVTYNPDKGIAFYKCCHDRSSRIVLFQKNDGISEEEIEPEVKNYFDKNDFCYVDWVKKYAGTVFDNYDGMLSEFKQDFSRVLARIAQKKEVFFVKHKPNYYDFITDFGGNNVIKIRYKYRNGERENITDIKVKYLIISLKSELPLYSTLCCKINPK